MGAWQLGGYPYGAYGGGYPYGGYGMGMGAPVYAPGMNPAGASLPAPSTFDESTAAYYKYQVAQ